MSSNVFVRRCYSCTWLCSVLTHWEAMVQLACTIIGLISLDTYLGECAAVLVLQCCLATCTPDALWHTTACVMTYCGSPTVVTSCLCESGAAPYSDAPTALCSTILEWSDRTAPRLRPLHMLLPIASASPAAPHLCLLQ